LQCAAVCCSVLQCAAVCCSVLQCVAVCCSMVQYGTVCCSVLQCVVHFSCYDHIESRVMLVGFCVAVCCCTVTLCNTLQHIATHLQHTAKHGNTQCVFLFLRYDHIESRVTLAGHYVAVCCCSVLLQTYAVAACFLSLLYLKSFHRICIAVCCSVMQCVT